MILVGILAIVLNCFLYKLGSMCSKTSAPEEAASFKQKPNMGKEAILTLFFSEYDYFCNIEFDTEQKGNHLSLSTMFPLYFDLVSEKEANSGHKIARKELFREG